MYIFVALAFFTLVEIKALICVYAWKVLPGKFLNKQKNGTCTIKVVYYDGSNNIGKEQALGVWILWIMKCK